MGRALTNPLVSERPVMVNVASISRRSPAASVAPNRPPGSNRGPAFPARTGRVNQIEPSFLGYPWCHPRASEKSLSTQMYAHREYISPRKEHRMTTKASLYCDRTGSTSSSNESEHDCQSANTTA